MGMNLTQASAVSFGTPTKIEAEINFNGVNEKNRYLVVSMNEKITRGNVTFKVGKRTITNKLPSNPDVSGVIVIDLFKIKTEVDEKFSF